MRGRKYILLGMLPLVLATAASLHAFEKRVVLAEAFVQLC